MINSSLIFVLVIVVIATYMVYAYVVIQFYPLFWNMVKYDNQ